MQFDLFPVSECNTILPNPHLTQIFRKRASCKALLIFMARFTNLPSEVVQDIVFYVLLGDQSTSPSVESFRYEGTRPFLEIWIQYITDYAKSKIATGSFTDGVLAANACPGQDAWFHPVLHRMFAQQRCSRSGLLALLLTSR